MMSVVRMIIFRRMMFINMATVIIILYNYKM